MNAELALKLERVRALVAEAKADGALVGRQSNFSWLACGGEAHIPLTTDRTFGQLLVTPKGFYVLANRIEMPRLQAEPLRGLGAEPLLYDWADARGAVKALRAVVEPRRVVSDTGDWGTRARPELFPPLRYSLLPVEVRRYRALGRDAESAVNLTCRDLLPDITEYGIAGYLAEACWHLDLTPTVLLVAVDDRIGKFRHPLPTRQKLRRRGMVVLCARRHGLIVALTRLVQFGPVPVELRQRHVAVCTVDAAFHAATRVGAAVREVFRRGLAAYAQQGYPEEWRLHHQGGPCGYEGRDYLGTPDAPGRVLDNQPFAWNPSITGTKSEDTILATAEGPEVITAASDWPLVEVACEGGRARRPAILER